MPDIDRLDRLIAHIEANPETHAQEFWIIKGDCGTAMCLAGHAVFDAYPQAEPFQIGKTVPYHFDGVRLPDGRKLDIQAEATELLKLTGAQADQLFFSGNTLDDIKAMRDILVKDPDAGWDELEAAYRAAREAAT